MTLTREKHPGGRPTVYKAEHIRQAKLLGKMGATDGEVAQFFGVNVATIFRWKNLHPKFCEALQIGKAIADARVEKSLYQRAIGYTHDDVDIRSVDGVIIETPIVKHYPPDTTACIFWLKNRKPKEWRDKLDLAATGDPLKIIIHTQPKK